MNIVFYGLVLLSMVFATVGGVPERDAVVASGVAVVDAPAGAAKEDPVELGPSRTPGKIESVEAGRATVRVSAADGATTVRFPRQSAMAAVSKASLDSAKGAIEFALGLVGAMTLFLGLMKVLEAAGGLDAISRLLRPAMVRLFPDVPPDHPAMGAMIVNLAANVLGLTNAATPFGIKAMQELEKLNPRPGVATNSMVLFLAINTSGVAVLPTGMIAMRASLGSTSPASIFATTLLATSLNTIVAIFAAKGLQRFFGGQPPGDVPRTNVPLLTLIPMIIALSGIIALIATVYRFGDLANAWIVPGLIFGLLTIGVVRKVRVYEVFITGARDGFETGVKIMPYLVGILVTVAMFRASGGMGYLVDFLTPAVALIGMPAEVLPVALLRPLSGTGAFGITAEIMRTHGPDSHVGQLAATMQGSSETTFYVLAVYFGSVGITRLRHAVPVGLISDAAGVLASLFAVAWLLG